MKPNYKKVAGELSILWKCSDCQTQNATPVKHFVNAVTDCSLCGLVVCIDISKVSSQLKEPLNFLN
jgi:transcription elongation factor Elf1